MASESKAGLPMDLRAIVSLTGCKVVGLISASLLPLLVPALIKDFGLSASSTGLLVSAQMICFAGIGLLVSLIIHRSDRRHLAIAGLVAICLGNAICLMSDAFAPLLAGRMVIGGGEGILTAATTAAAAGSKMPERIFGFFAAAIAIITAAILYFLPGYILTYGSAAIFVAVIGLAIVVGGTLIWFPGGLPPRDTGKSGNLLTLGWTAGLVLLAACTFTIGMGTIQTYLGVIGGTVGATPVEIGRALALGSLVGIGVSLTVVAVGTRFGRSAPLLGAGILLVALALTATSAGTVSIFLFAAMLFNPTVLLLSPFQYGLMAFLDKQGRIAAAAPVFIKLGFSIGPALGGMVLDSAGPRATGMFAAAWIALGIALYVTMAQAASRGWPIAQGAKRESPT